MKTFNQYIAENDIPPAAATPFGSYKGAIASPNTQETIPGYQEAFNALYGNLSSLMQHLPNYPSSSSEALQGWRQFTKDVMKAILPLNPTKTAYDKTISKLFPTR